MVDPKPDEPDMVYLVVAERGGLQGAWVGDEGAARRYAEATECVMVALPITADYRKGGQRA